MKHSTKKFVLQELMDYEHSCRELKKLQERLEYIKAIEKPIYTTRQLENIMLRITYLTKITEAINEVMNSLNKDLLMLMQEKFIKKPIQSDKEIMKILSISETKFYKDQHLICQMLADRLGIA